MPCRRDYPFLARPVPGFRQHVPALVWALHTKVRRGEEVTEVRVEYHHYSGLARLAVVGEGKGSILPGLGHPLTHMHPPTVTLRAHVSESGGALLQGAVTTHQRGTQPRCVLGCLPCLELRREAGPNHQLS